MQTYSSKEKIEMEVAKREFIDDQIIKIETNIQTVIKTINDFKNLVIAMNMKIDSWPCTLIKVLVENTIGLGTRDPRFYEHSIDQAIHTWITRTGMNEHDML